MSDKKVTVLDVKQAKKDGRKLAMVTAYDYPFGLMADEAGVDIVLIGDSLGMVVMGLEGTVEVTMEHMIHHIRAVVRGCKGPLVVGDMPFMSYNTSIREAIINAGRLMKEGGCDVVKLEGGVDFASTVEAIVKAGIPVQGHIGLTPQTASALGGFKMQGKDAKAAMRIVDDAKALEDAGVFFTHDMIGLFDKFVPKFVKQYTKIRPTIINALKAYKDEVVEASFPGPEHSFKMSDTALEQLKKLMAS